MKKNHIVLGGAGFIGTNLVKYLLDQNCRVFVIDDMSLGKRENIHFLKSDYITECDLSLLDKTEESFKDITGRVEHQDTTVWHLAANSDIQAGVSDITVDYKKTFLTTLNTLIAMEKNSFSEIIFASTSAVYGDHGADAINEKTEQLPISNYGAMKKASEAILLASTSSFIEKLHIFRFPNVVGAPATHGVIHDFIKKLGNDPSKLEVLGNGTQKKSYLHVSDLINAMLHVMSVSSREVVNIHNVGPIDDGMLVADIARTVSELMGLSPNIIYGEGNKGWVGDVPQFVYSIDKIISTGWNCERGSKAAVVKAIKEIMEQ